MGQLLVVRHGQASLLTSDYDRLSEVGRQQASRLGEHWAGSGVVADVVFCGPAKRHRDTAALVAEAMQACGVPWPEVQVVPEIDEHDAFTMVAKAVPRLREDPEVAALQEAVARAQAREDRSKAFQKLFEIVMARWLTGELELEDVERWPEFRERVERGVRRMIEVRASGQRVVAFTSVGPTAVMLRSALETTDRRSFETAWRLRNASVTSFAFGKGRFTLDSFNALPHLPDPTDWTFR
jgi:broad specificity phosphatase PhoE